MTARAAATCSCSGGPDVRANASSLGRAARTDRDAARAVVLCRSVACVGEALEHVECSSFAYWPLRKVSRAVWTSIVRSSAQAGRSAASDASSASSGLLGAPQTLRARAAATTLSSVESRPPTASPACRPGRSSPIWASMRALSAPGSPAAAPAQEPARQRPPGPSRRAMKTFRVRAGQPFLRRRRAPAAPPPPAAQRPDEVAVVLVGDLARAVVELELLQRGERPVALLREREPRRRSGVELVELVRPARARAGTAARRARRRRREDRGEHERECSPAADGAAGLVVARREPPLLARVGPERDDASRARKTSPASQIRLTSGFTKMRRYTVPSSFTCSAITNRSSPGQVVRADADLVETCCSAPRSCRSSCPARACRARRRRGGRADGARTSAACGARARVEPRYVSV